MGRNIKPNIQIECKHEDDYYYKVIAKNVRLYRTEKNLTQEQLAELINISTCYVSDIENVTRGKRITIATLTRIADTLNKDISLFFRDN